MSDALISVIIPIYNMEAFLSRCLNSVLNNTYRNLEIICIDDGSTDKSLEILRDYETIDSRLVVISKENGGVSSARNAGLDRMTGEYVSFVDPDDYVHPQYFELLFQALEKDKRDIAICSYSSVDADDIIQSEPYVYDPSEVHEYTISEVFQLHDLRSYCWGKLILSSLVVNTRFHEDLKYVEDTVFFSEVSEKANSLIPLIPYKLYYYYQREGSLTKEIKPLQHLQAAKHLAQNLLSSDGRDDIYLEQTIKRCLNTRYMSTHIFPDREVKRECNILLNSLQKRLFVTQAFGWKSKLVLRCFSLFPLLYWIFRSIKEPYMWKWEQVERKKRREARIHSVGNQ